MVSLNPFLILVVRVKLARRVFILTEISWESLASFTIDDDALKASIVKRLYWFVLDSLGIGGAPDAEEYGDCGQRYLGAYRRVVCEK